MKLLNAFLDSKPNSEALFDHQKGKTLAQYQQELLVKMARKQFQRLQDLGLSIPVQLA